MISAIYKYHRLLLTAIIMITTYPLMAQGGPPATPIDGGLSILLAAGGIYGIKKIRDSRRKQ